MEAQIDKLNYNPKEILAQIYQKLKEDEKIFAIAFHDIKNEMKSHGIQILSDTELNEGQLKWCKDFFKKNT